MRQGVAGHSVLGHVGDPGHHAAAQGAAENLHVTGLRPLIGCCIVVLDIIRGGEAVEAPDNKEPIINHFDAEVAAGGQHEGHCVPGVGPGVEGLSTAQTGVAIKATNLLEEK